MFILYLLFFVSKVTVDGRQPLKIKLVTLFTFFKKRRLTGVNR